MMAILAAWESGAICFVLRDFNRSVLPMRWDVKR